MNKKLLGALAVICTLGAVTLAGCGKSGSTSIDPISDIEVARPTKDFIVGDTINLDEYVDVIGGPGAKQYSVTIRPASKNIVSIEGHTLTVLKEGPISLLVEAGEQSSIISWESLSKERAAYKNFTAGVDKNFTIYDLDFFEEGGQEFIGTTGEVTLHNEKYFMSVNQTGTYEGFVLLGDGNIYDFEADDVDGTNLNVLPGPTSGMMWDYYFVNMGFAATYDQFQTVTQIVQGQKDTYLEIPASVEVPSGMEDYARNYADYVMLTTWGFSTYNLTSEFASQVKSDTIRIEVRNLSTDPTEPFYTVSAIVDLVDSLVPMYGKSTYLTLGLLGVEEEDYQVPALENYLEEGTIPDPIDLTPVKQVINGYAALTNYTQYTKLRSVGASSNEYISGDNVINGDATTLVDLENKIIFNTYVDGNGKSESFGYFEKEGKLYFFEPDEKDSTKYNINEEKEDTFSNIANLTGVNLWVGENQADLVASYCKENTEDNTFVYDILDTSTDGAFVTGLMLSAPMFGVSNAKNSIGYTQYADMYWTLDSNGNLVDIVLNVPVQYKGSVENFSPEFTYSYGNFGTTDAVSALNAILGEN